MPARIDVHQQVPVPQDGAEPSCPHCRTPIEQVKHHERVVEDIVPAKVITTCDHTAAGIALVPKARGVRAGEQPPAADLRRRSSGSMPWPPRR